MADDATLMGLALEQAAAAADRGDPGFGAVMALELARLLGPRAIHLEDLRADYGHQILIERGLRHDEGLKVLARSLRPR